MLAAVPVAFTRFDGGVAFIWAASGLLLARLGQLHARSWFSPIMCCTIAILIESSVVGLGWRAAPLIAIALIGEAVVAASLLRYVVGFKVETQSVQGLSWFIALAGGVAPFLSGVVAAAVVSEFANGRYLANLLAWFAAHALGALLFTPIATAAITGSWIEWIKANDRRALMHTAGLLFAVAAISTLVFSQATMPILFLPMLPMVFATVRGGRMAAISSTVILAIVGGICTARGSGPIHLMVGSAGQKSLFLQAYIACAALLVLPVAALLQQRSELAERWRESEARYRAIANSIGDAIIEVSGDGTIRYASPAISSVIGISVEDIVGHDARQLVCTEDQKAVWKAHQQALAVPGRAVIVQYREPERAQSAQRWYEASMRAVSADGCPKGLVGSIRDISSRKAEELALTKEARADPLTGLANRRTLMAELGKRWRDSTNGVGEGSLALLDLDHFKSINDSYGHPAGDAVLKAVAATARRLSRGGDCVGRIGGEEFAIIYWDVSADVAKMAAYRLQAAIRDLRVDISDGRSITVRASIGMAAISGDTPEAIIGQADSALYQAKRSGRDCLRVAA